MVGLRFSHPPSSVVSEPTVREEEADNVDTSRAVANDNDDSASGPMAVPDFIAHVMHSRAAISVGEFLARVRDHGDRVGQWLIPRVQLGHLLSVATEQGSIDELVDCDALAALFLNHVHPVPGGGAAEDVGLDGDDGEARMFGDNESAISSSTTSSCSSSASDQSPPASTLSSSTNPYVTSPRPKDADLSPADADAGRRPRTTSSRIAHAISLRSTSARRMASTSRVRRGVSRDRTASPDGSSSTSKKKSKKKSRKSHRASDPPTNDPSLVSFNSSADPFDLNGTDLDFVVTPPMPGTPRRLTSSQYSSTPPSPAPSSSVRSHSFPEPHLPHRHHHHHHRSTTRAARLAALDPAVLVQQLQEYEAHFAAVRDQNAQLKAREDQHLQALAEYEAKLQEMAHDRRNLAITLSTARRTAAEAENSLFDIACERDAAMEAQAAAEAQVAQWRRANAELKAHLEVALQRMDAYKAQLENVHGALDEARLVEAQLRDEVEHYHDQLVAARSVESVWRTASTVTVYSSRNGVGHAVSAAWDRSAEVRTNTAVALVSSGLMSVRRMRQVVIKSVVLSGLALRARPYGVRRRAAVDPDGPHPAEHDDDALDAFDLDASAPGNRSLCFELESALAAEADAKQLEELTAQLSAAQDEVTALKAALDETATRATRAEHDRDDATAQAASLQIQVRHWQRLAESMHPTYAQAAASRRTMGTQTPTSTAAKQTRDVEAAQHENAQLRSVNRHQQESFKVEHDTPAPARGGVRGDRAARAAAAELMTDSNTGKKSKRKKKKGKSSAAKQQANKATTTKPKQREEAAEATTTGSVIAPPSAPSPAPAAPASPRASRPASVVSRSSDSSISSLSRLTALPPLTPKSPTLSTFSRRVGPDMNAPGTRRVSTLLTGLSSPPARGNGLRRRTSAAPPAVSAASVAFPPPAPLLATPRPVYKSSPTSSAASTAPPASTSSASLASLMSDLDLESDGGHSGNPKRLRIRSIARGFLAAVVLNIGFLIMLVLTSAGLWNPAAVGGRRGLPAAEWRRAPAMVGGVGAGAAAAAVAVGATRTGGAWRRQ
ncbi:hypothetical protein AMAG_18090 [Allomyces macrogynus ATCC 38327]|uniref:Uncharacterized protein n=1 Tax=Allomyces macrogynus (strain ATCC 38327) TaxID=578462 RepID=A0A0L0S9J7_ALLM3|nr:hypothetical protein AMAG_18090 [Allomyces macrogynus ATCC 38327]|eukprot:KNE59065.1 hypothetical protein AMAG_18090 [Allomyces macrogynus ATCC 38327]